MMNSAIFGGVPIPKAQQTAQQAADKIIAAQS